MATETRRLALVGSGMAISISNNAVLGSIFRDARPLEIDIAICVAGLLMLVIALCFSELSSRFPGSVGFRASTRAAFGESWSAALTSLYIVMAVGMGAFESHLCYAVFRTALPAVPAAVAVATVLGGIVWVNLTGFEAPSKLQSAATVSVIIMLWCLAIMGLMHAPARPSVVVVSHAFGGGILFAIPTSLFLFVGIEWACLAVKRREDYAKELPRGLKLAIALVALTYLPLAAAFGRVLDLQLLPTLSLPHLALAPRGSAVWYLAVAISLLALITTFNVGLGGTARMVYALAREGAWPKVFVRLSIPGMVPYRATLFVAGAVLLLTPLLSLESMFSALPRILALNLCVVYLVALGAWFRLRRVAGVPFKVPVWVVWLAVGVIFVVLANELVSRTSVVYRIAFTAEILLVLALKLRRPFHAQIVRS
jgi:amino acid transporter